MDCGACDGSNGKDEAAEPHCAGDPGGVIDVVPVEAAGDDAGDESGLAKALVPGR